MADTVVKLRTIEGKNFVDVDDSVKSIKKELETSKSILIIACGIQISRVAIVIRRVQEECNCAIAKMEIVNKKEKGENGKEIKVMEFHTKLIKRD